MHDPDRLETYDYPLPENLIAQQPLPERDASRLMLVRRSEGTITHHTIRDLPELLSPGDGLVLNNSRVLPARLKGLRTATGGKWEGLFLSVAEHGNWRLIGQTRGRLMIGETVTIPAVDEMTAMPPLELRLVDRESDGIWRMEPVLTQSLLPRLGGAGGRRPDEGVVMRRSAAESPLTLTLSPAAGERGQASHRQDGGFPERSTSIRAATALALELLSMYGTLPLPPYIARSATAADQERYQTAYARQPGSIAAPTAGLHFTPELLARCRSLGIETAEITLHVGLGTFRPVSVEDLTQHVMHAEFCEISAETASQLAEIRKNRGRIVAVGTTSARTLEAAYAQVGWQCWRGETRIFIRPPYPFQAVDALLTNFHLPKSTLLMLVSALAGVDLIRRAYAAAVAERYRFFSYGDAMLIV